MRMLHYFLAAALLLVPALGWTIYLGLSGDPRHLLAGLVTAVLAVGVHTLLILFMIVTGRILREAMRARPLGPEFLEQLNNFFERKPAYPLAVLGAVTITVAGVLGYAGRGFGLPAAVHMLVGTVAAFVNLWALQAEFRALSENQVLVDRVAAELDRIDLETGEVVEDQPPDPARAAHWGLIVAVSAWFPYLYWVFIHWRGDFTRVSLHPWIEGSLFGLGVWWLGRREVRRVAASPPALPPRDPSSEAQP